MLLLSLAGLVLAICLLGIVVTHRIAGPAWAIRNILAGMARGKLSCKRQLRQGDELKLVGYELHHLQESLRQRELTDIEILEQAMAQLGKDTPDTTQAQAILSRMSQAKQSRLDEK